MKTGLEFAATAIAAIGFLASSVTADVDPIVIKGSKFFYQSNGTQFFMKGVAYQQDVSTNTTVTESVEYRDPLANEANCRRDIPFLQELQTNTIRVYAIDPAQNHDACMQLLQDAGIYVVADLSQPGLSINRDDPAWNDDLYARYTQVVDVLADYTNTLGFFAGNEVSNQPNNTAASAFVKAAVRDTKAYIAQKGYRKIGVGYATNDDAIIREDMADYFNCGNTEEAIDFWGYNIYSWCGNSTYRESGYDRQTSNFASYSVPVFFAEYGCNQVQPRTFTDVEALYSEPMTDVWSGGIVYMYFQEANDYGLVEIDGNNVERNEDFTYLSSQIAAATPTGVAMNDYNPTNTVPANCPSVAPTWGAASSPLPPTPNKELCECMMDTLTCTIRPSTNEDDFEDLFGTVCGLSEQACQGIYHNGTTGEYGAYSMCNAREQLAFAFNQYYQGQRNNPSACDFGGAAATQAASSAQGNCAALISQAGTAGTGSVTSVPSGAGGSRSSTAAASAITVPAFNVGLLQLGAYILGATLTGAGMILL
ncbi:hypothetical protein W97_06115 [Coniosporium apollinis CBS 100218]|uniref:1,3-beta-glucanosyltransferase n=1 Tax=Coniosporium apollinis (strain CBS 100218) TaxID=1168221 RepID=R7YYX8_CONA1|nr:uncharacterized protein W97_06115 [Coniosporium apollinis CBS 100218]EON66999.1 hypothetical protein W97_06115 [Coniosporium apollinis CBS 100218]